MDCLRKSFDEKLQNTNKFKLKHIENKLANIHKDDVQILEFKKIIEKDYRNIVDNKKLTWEHFQNNFMKLSGNWLTKELVEKKYNELSDKEIIEIAKRLNENNYTEYPRYELELSVINILKYTFFNISYFFLFIIYLIINFLKLAYIPIDKSKNIYWKLVFFIIEASILFFIGKEFIQNTVNNILPYIKIILFLYVLFIIAFSTFKIFFYKNKKKCTEQNYKDYTVGYYFIENYNEIMYRIAKAHLLEMKNNSPNEYDKFILEIQDKLKKERDYILEVLEK